MHNPFSRKLDDATIKDFLHQHLSDKLIIILDPHDDSMYAKYGKNYVLTQIKSMDGKTQKVVKHVLKHSRFNGYIDKLIVGMAEGLKLSLRDGNQFWKWIDGALFNISKAIQLNKRKDNTYAQKESSSGSGS